ncbi:hypothetical protein FGIG_06113 [Fasciola gigantica]|uniref:Elongator complex protein 6 n=1 Tax=Fasciola gigantica TaxID=46835 RepID=A0A504Z0Z4_FASGI|nr:hypothetical protein FGIG_06113 [Fasciola gigantica]
MDLASVLGHDFTTDPLSSEKLTLLLSHELIDHGPVLCYIVGRLTYPSPLAIGDASQTDTTCNRPCLFVALQRAASIYQRSLGSVSQRLMKDDPGVHFIDISAWLKSKFLECDSTKTHESPCFQVAEDLCSYLTDQISHFFHEYSGMNKVVTMVFDDVTVLLDLGVSLSRIHQLVYSNIQSGTNKFPNIHLILGCHVGKLLDDSWASESDPSFAHWIDLLRSRANRVIDLRPLTTGYTTAVDGEVSNHCRVHS